MIDQTTLDGKIIIAAFDLAASPGWAEVSLRDIAEAAGCSLADVMERFSTKDAVLACFVVGLRLPSGDVRLALDRDPVALL